MSTLVTLPVAGLAVAATNPRKHLDQASAWSDEALVGSIRQLGCLQPPIVRWNAEAESHEVVIGQRRLRALQQIAAEGGPEEAEFFLVDGMTDPHAMLAGVAENTHRLPLDVFDAAETVDLLIRDFGHTLESVAVAFGRPLRAIRQMTAYLNVVPEAREAYRAGKMTAGHVQVFAMAPAETQRQWLKPADWTARSFMNEEGITVSPDTLRRHLYGEKVPTSAAIFPLEGCGLAIAEDLFGENGYFLDRGAFMARQRQAIEERAEELRRDWNDVLVMDVEYRTGYIADFDYAEPEGTPEQRAELERLEQLLGELNDELDSIAHPQEGEEPSPKWTTLSARYDETEEQIDALRGAFEYTEEQRRRLNASLQLNINTGEVYEVYGLEPSGRRAAAERSPGSTAAAPEAKPSKGLEELTAGQTTELQQGAAGVLAERMLADQHIALAYAAAVLTHVYVAGGYEDGQGLANLQKSGYQGALQLAGDGHAPKLTRLMQQQRDQPSAVKASFPQRFKRLLEKSDAELIQTITDACILGMTPGAAPLVRLQEMLKAVDACLRDFWTPGQTFIGGYNKDQLSKLGKAIGHQVDVSNKKADIVAELAAQFDDLSEDQPQAVRDWAPTPFQAKRPKPAAEPAEAVEEPAPKKKRSRKKKAETAEAEAKVDEAA